ncbi:MAG TPA: SPOR domain-containing protein [Rickettsiales bacterium]|nr:SPOR domain-containing protein [Rickettsiales bacterium]
MARDDDELEYDEDDEDENGGFFRWLQAVVVLFALGGFFGLAWYAYKSGGEVDEKDIEVVKPDKNPIKEAPADPGGMQIPNQDKTVYNLVNGDNREKQAAERIVPPTEEPVQKHPATETWMDEKLKSRSADGTKTRQFSPPSSAPLIHEDAKESAKNEDNSAQAASPNKPVLAAPTAPVAAAPAAQTAKPSQTAKSAPVKAAAAEQAPADDDAADNDTTEQAAPPPKKAAAAPAAQNQDLPKVRVQLGAYQSQAEADKEWKRISGTYSDELSGKQHYVIHVTVNGKHYYRLQAGPFASSKAASSACVSLMGDGQGCFLAKNK